MRRVNWTFAAGLVILLAAAAGAFHALHVVRYGKIADELRWQVERCREDGRTDDAIKFAAQYIQFRPGDVGMLADLAGWLDEKAETRKQRASVLGLYERILRLTPDDRAARRKAADLNMAFGGWAAALDNLDVLLRATPDDAELCENFGYCQQAVGKYDEAATWFQKAVRADPHRVTAYVRWAGLLQQNLKRPDEVIPVMDRAVQANPESGPAHVARAQFFRSRGELKEAAAAVRTARKLAPEDAAVLLTAADIEQSLGNYSAARDLLETGRKKYPKNVQFLVHLALQLLYDGSADRAIALLREAKTVAPADQDVLTLLGDLLAQDGQVGPLEDALRDLTELNASPDRVQYVQARLLIRRGRWVDAAALLDRLRVIALRTPALYRQANLLLAQCAEQIGDTTAELDAYRRLLDHDPNAGTVRLDYARALARAGRTDDALAEFLSVLSRPEVSSRAVAETARVLIEQAARDPKALARLEKAIETLKGEPNNPNPVLARAYLDLARYRPADSMPAVEAMIRARPRVVPLHIARALLGEQMFGLDRGLAALTDAEAVVGDQPDLRVARTRMLGFRLDPTYADALAALARGVERFGAEDRNRILREVVAAFRGLGDQTAVDRYLDLLAQVRPDSLPAREALFARALKAADEVRQNAILREVEGIEGADGPTVRLLDAERLLWCVRPGDSAALGQVEERLVAAGRDRPHDPVVEFLRGRVDELAGRPSDALVHYRNAFDRGLADRPVEDLFSLLPGKSGSAPVAVLRDQLPLADRLRSARHQSVIVAVQPLYDGVRLQGLAERLASAAAADGVQLVWLGRLFARWKLDAAAEAAFRRATAAAPQSPEGWLALIALQAGRPNADAVTAEVRSKLPPIEAHLVVGRALESVHQPDAARREYEAAAALNPADTRPLKLLANLAAIRGQADEARKRLEQIVALSAPTIREDQAWARRTLAVQLATTSPSAETLQRALTLVDANKVGDRLPDDDLRVRVLVLAARKDQPLGDGKSTARREAIRTLEGLRQRGSAKSADDLILLVRLYRAEGDAANAGQAREQLRREFPTHLGCVVFLARESLRDHDLRTCEKLLPSLRRLGAGTFQAVAIEFQWRALSGGPDLGRRVLDDYMATAPTAQARADRAVQCANLIYDFLQVHPTDERSAAATAELRASAIQLLRPEAERNPQAFQRLVTLVAQQSGGTPAAIDLVRRGRRVFGVEVAAACYVQLLRHGRPGPNDVQKAAIRQFIADERQKAPQSTPLALTWAEYLQLTGEHDEAILVYRQVLQREPDNVLALNNLAWALSLDRKDQAKVRESLGHIQRAIELAGPADELLDTRARILFEAGQPEAGLKDMNEALTDAPSAARLMDYAAMLRKAGKVQEADRAVADAARFSIGAPR